MAARAIIGIALGVLFAPVIYLLLFLNGSNFGAWFWRLFGSGDFIGWTMEWAGWGVQSTIAPIVGPVPNSLIDGFGSGSLFGGFLIQWGPSLVTWALVGTWAGALERSPKRGIGVGAGCWIGWLIITLILWFVNPTIAPYVTFQDGLTFLGITSITDLLLAQILTLIVVIGAAVIFGAITKSEEF